MFVCYASMRDDNWDIYVAPADGGGEETRLTEYPGADISPLWSPDGRYVLFARWGGHAGADLWALEVDPLTGTRLSKSFLVTQLGLAKVPGWSLTVDGELMMIQTDPGHRIFLVDVDPETGAPREEAKSIFKKGWRWPTWSADGRKLYFRGDDGLVENNLDTGDKHTTSLPSSYAVHFIARSPDGRTITLSGVDPEGKGGVFDFNPETGEILPLWRKARLFLNPPMSWSPDGEELLISTYGPSDRRLPIFVFRRSDGKLRRVGASSTRPMPQWSPDGTEIAYTEGHCLMVIPRTGGHARQVTCGPFHDRPKNVTWVGLPGWIGWAPDGRKLAWTVHNPDAKRYELWIVDYFTGEHLVAVPGEADYKTWPAEPQWSPDGTRIVFTLESKPQYELWALSNFLPWRPRELSRLASGAVSSDD